MPGLFLSFVWTGCVILYTNLPKTIPISEIFSRISLPENTDLKIYWVIKFGQWRTSPPSPPLCAALPLICAHSSDSTDWNFPVFDKIIKST